MVPSPKYLVLLAGIVLLVAAAPAVLTSTPSPQEEEMGDMQEMQMPAPGPEHKWLAKRVGTWNAAMKYRMAPGAPWMDMAGTEVVTSPLNGFWVLSTFKSTFMGQPFEGRAQTGYDQNKKQFVQTWVDSMSSYLNVAVGTLDKSTNVLTLKGMAPSQMTGQDELMTTTIKINDDGSTLMKMFSPGPDGEDFQTMEIHYTKQP